MSDMQEKIGDYLSFGVRYVWVVDPRIRRAWTYTVNRTVEVKDGVLHTENPVIDVALSDIFGAL